jgi:predicted Fe-Mo cluster-binding NifX family protein
MGKLTLAVPTERYNGLEDVVSEVFGKAKTFTIADVEDDKVGNVLVIENPASSYKHGSGPIVVKKLADLGVDLVLAAELGPGASELLKHHNITTISVRPHTRVSDSIKEALSKSKIQQAKQSATQKSQLTRHPTQSLETKLYEGNPFIKYTDYSLLGRI